MCIRGCAMKPKTVTSGHVSTRVCLRGSCATTSTQRSNLRSTCPAPWRNSYSPSAKARPLLTLDGVAQRHLLEGEDHAVARALLDAHGAGSDLGEPAPAQEPSELLARKRLLPALVRLPLVVALPGDVSLVAKPSGEEP